MVEVERNSETTLTRLIESELRNKLTYSGAVLVEGAKGVGKTFTSSNVAKSAFRADRVDLSEVPLAEWRQIALLGEAPHLIDEWQVRPELWNMVRREVDDRGGFGHFILTGSSTPANDATRHSGAGRFSRLRMRTLSSFESGLSQGSFPLNRILKGIGAPINPEEMAFDTVVDAILRGGLPSNHNIDTTTAARRVNDYLEESIRMDIGIIGTTQKRRDPEKIRAVIKSLSRAIGTSMSISKIAIDVQGHGEEVSVNTVESYLEALQHVMLVEFLPAWSARMRSRARLQTKPKRYFVDPSIAVAALQANAKSLYGDLELLGQLFENLVIRDLLIYSQHNDAHVSFFRNDDGLEVDAIIEQYGGAWIAVEVKMGSLNLDRAAKNLLTFASNLDPAINSQPAALVIVTAAGYCYKREDGVWVVPISVLGP